MSGGSRVNFALNYYLVALYSQLTIHNSRLTIHVMVFLLKIAYYASISISSLIAIFYLGATLLGLIETVSPAKTKEDTIMLVACCTALGILYKAYQLGHIQGNWGSGLTFVFVAILAFVVIFVGGMFMFGTIRWQ